MKINSARDSPSTQIHFPIAGIKQFDVFFRIVFTCGVIHDFINHILTFKNDYIPFGILMGEAEREDRAYFPLPWPLFL